SKQAAQQRHSMLRSLLGKFMSGTDSAMGHLLTRFTAGARRVVVLGQEQARELGHSRMGTEHLLLGLLAEGEGVAARALQQAGIALEPVKAEIAKVIGHGEGAPKGHIPFTPRAKKVLELGLRESFQLNHKFLGTEHILLGLIREGDGLAAQTLVKLGADLGELRVGVLALLSSAETASGTE